MKMGPLEFLVIGFPGNQFTGAITAELDAIRAAGIIRIVDLVLIMKTDEGEVMITELDDFDRNETEGTQAAAPDEAYAALSHSRDLLGLLTTEDIMHAADAVPAGSSAAIALFEHRWALGLQEAVRDAGGILLAQDRVSAEAFESLMAELTLAESGSPEHAMSEADA